MNKFSSLAYINEILLIYHKKLNIVLRTIENLQVILFSSNSVDCLWSLFSTPINAWTFFQQWHFLWHSICGIKYRFAIASSCFHRCCGDTTSARINPPFDSGSYSFEYFCCRPSLSAATVSVKILATMKHFNIYIIYHPHLLRYKIWSLIQQYHRKLILPHNKFNCKPHCYQYSKPPASDTNLLNNKLCSWIYMITVLYPFILSHVITQLPNYSS